MGQYLRPTRDQLPVLKYYTPEEFDRQGDISASILGLQDSALRSTS